MNRPGALAAVAAAIPLAFMAVLLGFLLLVGIGGESPSGTAACSTDVSSAGQPPLVRYYLAAAAEYRLGSDGYAYLAAINRVETSFGTNVAVSSAGAIGWMQFEPATFAKYGVSVTDPEAAPDASDPQDAIYSAANYLNASGAPANWGEAILAYNHSQAYVDEVEGLAARYSGPQGLTNLQTDITAAWGDQQPETSPTAPAAGSTTESISEVRGSTPGGTCSEAMPVDDVMPVAGSVAVIMPNGLARPGSSAPPEVQAMVDAGDRITSLPYSYGGGHCAAAMNQAVPDPQTCPGDEENGAPGFDCSAATSYLLWGSGHTDILGDQPETSGQLEDAGAPGVDPNGSVTWWASPGHAFIEVDGIVMDTVHGPSTQAPDSAPATGPRWQAAAQVHWELTNDTATGTFVPRHLPRL